jgi:hypothetical protein
MFDAREFRRSLAAFATGVAIVTTTDGNGLRARAWRHSRAPNILPSTPDRRSAGTFTAFLIHRRGQIRRCGRCFWSWGYSFVKRMCLRPLTVSESGTGQGSVISPLLANAYLHYVFDLWAERCDGTRPRATSLSCAMPTTSSLALSTRRTPGASGMRCASGCRSSRCRSIRRRPA